MKRIAIENEDYMAAKQIKATQQSIMDQVTKVDLKTGKLPDEIDPAFILQK